MVVWTQLLCSYDFTVGYSFHLLLLDKKFSKVNYDDVSKPEFLKTL